jgi:hypothetical protein
VGLLGTGEANFESDNGLDYPAEALERLHDTAQPTNSNSLISLAPVDESHTINRARWVKFVILLYNYDIETGHCLDDNHLPSEAISNPAPTTNPSVEDYLHWEYLETASFGDIYLTHTGTVLYLGNLGPYMLVDERGLQSGRLTEVEYEINGTVKESVEIRPFNMEMPYSRISNAFHGIRNTEGAHRHENQP